MPIRTDKNKDIIFLARWVESNKSRYIKQDRIMKDELIRKKWEEFITDEKYKHYF